MAPLELQPTGALSGANEDLLNDREIAAAFEATPDLVPFIPDLVADLWELGSWPDVIVDLLRPLGLPPHTTRALDLGCGKGAVAITLAQELGFTTVGVDLCQPFIEDARRQAAECGVPALCTFEVGDMRDAMGTARGFDVVVYAAVGNVLGTPAECVARLRNTVRTGGYIVFDDGFLAAPKPPEVEGYTYYLPHDTTVEQLCAHGDVLLGEVIIPMGKVRAQNQRYFACIRRHADSLSSRHPELAQSLQRYIARQQEANAVLESDVASAVWLLEVQ